MREEREGVERRVERVRQGIKGEGGTERKREG